MPGKSIKSVRFPDKPGERITADEWELFRPLASYFVISDSGLVEAALRYATKQRKPSVHYSFNQKSFDDMCHRISGLTLLLPSMSAGRTNVPIQIASRNLRIMLPAGTMIRFYPPYIISAEPTYQLRINIDLSERSTIMWKNNHVEIHCAEV